MSPPLEAVAPQSSDQWIVAFLDAIAAEADAARNTLLAYGRDLKDFAAWTMGQKLDLASLPRSAVEDYLIFCDAQGLSKATRARRLASLRHMFRFAVEEGWRQDNPALRIKGPGKSKDLPQTLSVQDVELLLTQARASGRGAFENLRNIALLELLYATGMRVTELVSLPQAAVRGNPRMILVRGKGDKERLVPLSQPAREAVAEWLKVLDQNAELTRKTGKLASPYLFPGRATEDHLTRQYVFNLIKTLALKAGLDPRTVTPHVLRHAFATHLLAGGADLRVIQMLLGHADVATTEIYTHVLDEHLRDLVLNHHPLANRKPRRKPDLADMKADSPC